MTVTCFVFSHKASALCGYLDTKSPSVKDFWIDSTGGWTLAVMNYVSPFLMKSHNTPSRGCRRRDVLVIIPTFSVLHQLGPQLSRFSTIGVLPDRVMIHVTSSFPSLTS